jgi:hypothetical protein
MRGRGTRKARNKPTFTMFDFVGVSDYHGDDDDFADGGVIREPQKRKKYEPRRLLALDVDDHIDPTLAGGAHVRPGGAAGRGDRQPERTHVLAAWPVTAGFSDSRH